MVCKTMIVYTKSLQRISNFITIKHIINDLELYQAVDTVTNHDLYSRISKERKLLTDRYIAETKTITGKLGCNLSHIFVLEAFLKSTDAWLLVLEDDIKLVSYNDIILNTLIKKAETYNSHYIQLYTNLPEYGERQRKAKMYSENLYEMIAQWHTCSYLIDRVGARITLEHLPFDENIDWVFSNLIPKLNSLCYLNDIFVMKGALCGSDKNSEFGSIIWDSECSV
jgi:GR25 family glycosyltransferase involved in LPS biosynthesis